MGFLDKLFGGKAAKATVPTKPDALGIVAETGAVYAPVSGTVEETGSIPDPVFACEAMGKTVAIWPSSGEVFAPISGTVTAAMPHALGIMGDDGIEILIHVGVDTVNMKGEGFTVFAKGGEHVEVGTPLLSFDRSKVAGAGYKDIVMIIVTNSDDYPELAKVAKGDLAAGDRIIQAA